MENSSAAQNTHIGRVNSFTAATTDLNRRQVMRKHVSLSESENIGPKTPAGKFSIGSQKDIDIGRRKPCIAATTEKKRLRTSD